MNYAGIWVLHSVGVRDEDMNLIYVTPENYLNYPMPYVDEDDPEAVADEIRERKSILSMRLRIDPDGTLYSLMAIPEGVSQEEVDEAIAAGEFMLVDGMLCQGTNRWELRGDELWADLGMSEDGWDKLSNEEGLLDLITFRFAKLDQ